MQPTILSMLNDAVRDFPDEPYALKKTDSGYVGKSFAEVRRDARFFASWLIDRGLGRGKAVAILAEGSPEWITGEFGAVYAGCASVPLSIKLLPDEIPYRLAHSESKVVIVTRNTFDRVAQGLAGEGTLIVCADAGKADLAEKARARGLDPESVIGFDEAVAAGQASYGRNAATVDRIETATTEDDVVTICYTSGTTGNPKGIMLTHRNYVANCRDGVDMFKVPRGFRTLLVLPCDHSFAHTVGIYAALLRGIQLFFVDARGGGIAILRNIPVNLLETNPTFLLTVPSLSGNFMKKIVSGIEAKGGLVEWIFKHGISAGIAWNGDGFHRPPARKRMAAFIPYLLARATVFPKVREIFGKDLLFCVGGGALLDVRQQEFFMALGVPIYQGYGLTEAAPIISSNTSYVHKLGTSGMVTPTVTCRIVKSDGNGAAAGETGEIVIKGDNVMKGYFKNPEATAQVLRDGWLFTGDLGHFDSDGFLVVTGREKALLISEDGEKYSPEDIEETIQSSQNLVSQVMLYNDHRKYTCALVVIDREKAAKLIERERIATAAELVERIREALFAFREDPGFRNRFPANWLPSTFAILPEGFTEQNHMINSTLKMVRHRITEAHRETIEYLYCPEGCVVANPRNLAVLRSLFGFRE
jgi:long-chain acyl-CoA synthetase